MNINGIMQGMTAQEREVYLEHCRQNAKWEQQRVQVERESNLHYREMLIHDILKDGKGRFELEKLQGYSTRALERIYDYL